MPSQLSDCTRCDLRAPKIQNFLGERPPRPPPPPPPQKNLCLKCTGYYPSSSLCPPSKPKISILPPPLGEFSKKNTEGGLLIWCPLFRGYRLFRVSTIRGSTVVIPLSQLLPLLIYCTANQLPLNFVSAGDDMSVSLALNKESKFKRNLSHFGPTSLRSTIAHGLLR